MEINNGPTMSGYDAVIIGGGFYGCYLANELAKRGQSVLICEIGAGLMERASAVNQARVHTGFHYPRSYVTALRSLHHYQRFADDFAPAVQRDFKMLYAIARHGTKVNAQRFIRMFESMSAPIEEASVLQQSLFDRDQIEGVFACTEYAFDYQKLRLLQVERMNGFEIDISINTKVQSVQQDGNGDLEVSIAEAPSVKARRVFNVTYSMLNSVLKSSGIKPLDLKHELVEIALIEPPAFLNGLAVTVMDGPFFSMMPWPAAAAYSLTHVTHTPHFSWTDGIVNEDAYSYAERLPTATRWRQMAASANRYLTSAESIVWRDSLFEVKTVPPKNESDDGRPILLLEHIEIPGFYSVLGSKIDNVYDLVEAIC